MKSTATAWIDEITAQTPGYEARLFTQYRDRLMAFARSRMPGYLARRIDADDVVQSVFRSFFKRHARGEFRFEQELDVWQLLVAITYRKVLAANRHHRRQARDVACEESTAPAVSPVSVRDVRPGPEDLATMLDLLQWIMQQLPENYRPLVELRLEGLTITGIAQRASVSERTVRRVLYRVRQLLSEHHDV